MPSVGSAAFARCIVIGGTGALGRILCRTLAGRGARVGLTYRADEATARALESEVGASIARLDVTAVGDVARAVDDLEGALGGPADALVYAAAIGSGEVPPVYDRLATVGAEAWDRVMAVNVRGAFFAVQRFARAGRPGNVVLLGSTDGEKSVPSPPPYATSKAALSGMARSLSKELGPMGVRINVVAPGLLEGGASDPVPESVRVEYLKHSGAKRYGKHEEVASWIAWLALENSYVTGRTMILDGGL